MENCKIIDEIVKYYMNPSKYPNTNKDTIEDSISSLNEILEGRIEGDLALLQELFGKYTSESPDASINATILKTRADNQGISATRGYKEIYFNEIIQNANDNTSGTELEINCFKKDNTYKMTFTYADKGFSVENIIGFFNTEIHTKRENISATGKHGVGIKSLFYFVDHMKIESNVVIEFKIIPQTEDGIEKIIKVNSKILKNNDWYHCENKKTVFTIEFPDKEDYGGYNVKKLKDFIDLCSKGREINDKYFFSENQEELIFDARSLLFTDKNKGKESGIKKIIFKDYMEKPIFSISSSEINEYCNEKSRCCLAQVKYNEEIKYEFLLFTLEGDDEKTQNFSAAFPLEIKCSSHRYYETFYIPNAYETGLNILINSKYSSVDRTKLTDDDSKMDSIKSDMEGHLLEIYEFMVSEELNNSLLRTTISILFHEMLQADENFIDYCSCYQLNNRFLQKHLEESNDTSYQYIFYERQEKELYERKLIGQISTKDDMSLFFEKHISKSDAAKFNPEVFLERIKPAYMAAFKDNKKLRVILNVAGSIKDLVYYRIHETFTDKEEMVLTDKEVDKWNDKIYGDCKDESEINISLSMIGRYKLHPYITYTGEIKGASFYEYLFNLEDKRDANQSPYPTLAQKQEEIFSKQYRDLKTGLLNLRVNREKGGTVNLYNYTYQYENGTIAFYGSWDSRANPDTYYDRNHCVIYDYYDPNGALDNNTDTFGTEKTELLIEKLWAEGQLTSHIFELDDRLMLTKDYPKWGERTKCYCRNNLLATGRWFTSVFININFLRNIYAHSWESFCSYVTFFKHRELTKFGGFSINTQKHNSPLFSIHKSELIQVFSFFYNNDQLYSDVKPGYGIKFSFNLTGKLMNNLCTQDYFEYIQEQLNIRIYVMETNVVNNKSQEILYVRNGVIKLIDNGNWHTLGKGIGEAEDEIIIVHNEKSTWKQAIKKVLENEYKNNDIIEKCDAFISANQKYAILGEEYDCLTGAFCEGNLRGQDVMSIKIDNKSLSVKALKKIISARGNNNNRCCCCGKEIDVKQLIITPNSSQGTSESYPEIIEVVCQQCEKILQKSHMKTKLVEEDNKWYVEYICGIQNTHQYKEVVFKHKLCDGVRELCRKVVGVV